MTIRSYGDRGVLVECGEIDDVLALHEALIGHPGIREMVPAARTLLILGARDEIADALRHVKPAHVALDSADGVEVPVVYDGEDLEETADVLGIGTDELIERHAAARWRVGFMGFAPGFGYQICDDPLFDVPRRATPRTRIPAGAVGLAGRYSGIYPTASPGGWRLIGHTPRAMLDPRRDPAVLLRPGCRVRYVPTDQAPFPSLVTATRQTDPERGLLVHDPGLLTLIEDAGRWLLSAGVSPSGAFDRASAREANLLAGNREDAPLLEILLGGAEFEARGTLLVGIAGAECRARCVSDGRDLDTHRPIVLAPGAVLRLGPVTSGARVYLAIRGGVAADETLGSASADLLSGLGPAPLARGDIVACGDHPARPLTTHRDVRPMPGLITLRVMPGPRADWFTFEALEEFGAQTWRVSPDSSRVGVRLSGIPLTRRIDGELDSEGAVMGAVQVPPDGQPVIFGADHPVTGGYPVAAVVIERDLDRVAQLRPGDAVRFIASREALC